MKSLISLRKEVLKEWRGLPEGVPERPEKEVGTILEKVIKKLGLQQRIGEEQIREAWQEVVGDFLAAHAEPSHLSRNILYIKVLQPTIRYELERVWKSKLLENLQARFGKRVIRSVHFIL